MNILYITNHLNIGGITSYVLTLATGLKKKGHNIYIASSGGLLTDEFKAIGAVYIPIPIKTKKEISPKILASVFKLRAQNKQCHFDIIHAHTRTTQVLSSLLSRSLDRPYISTCHGFFQNRLLRRIFPCWGCKIIAISQQVKEHLVGDFKVDEQKIAVIQNGVDIKKFAVHSPGFKVQRKRELGLADGPVIGILARLSDVKGHIYLIRAMKEILGSIPEAQLLIVGEGKMKEELIGLVNVLGIEKKVFFRPEVLDTREALSAMDIFVMPSLKEGLGLSLMEAMASEIAVIGSDVGGIRSLIKDKETGLLVKPADSLDIAAKLLELLQDTGKRDLLAGAGRAFIAANFSIEKTVEDTERLYLECLSK